MPDDDAAPAGDVDTDTVSTEPEVATRSDISPVRLAVIAGLVVIVALGGLTGWLSWRAHQATQQAEQGRIFLDVGRQGALNLTVFDYQNVDEQVQRTLDLATGKFYDDFQRRAPSFTDLVKQVKSKSSATILDAGLESQTATEAKVLVAVTVISEVAGQPGAPAKLWRMRMSIDEVDGGAKVSDVEFVS